MATKDIVTAEPILVAGQHIEATVHDDYAAHLQKAANIRLGLWLFIISDGFMFAGLFVTRFYLLGGTRPELDQALGLLVTTVLLLSSFFMNRAETMIAHGDQKGFLRGILLTMLLGLGFFIGVVAIEWPQAAQHIGGPGESAMASVFYMMTGMHAFHVITGIIFLLVVYLNGRKGMFSAERHIAVEACANYWHFVDV
ncbi:MAG: cytochrome c oxidase subunit 3, partial [Chloroflexales bacterium]|nr:cytochrome c oxidase subunit 3 [Chloroflexales bacterium]